MGSRIKKDVTMYEGGAARLSGKKVRVLAYKGWYVKRGDTIVRHAIDPFQIKYNGRVDTIKYDSYMVADEPLYEKEAVELFVKLMLNYNNANEEST